jgi:hypothetical protein
MPSTSLEKLLKAARPFVPFTFSDETLYARKLNQSDIDDVNKAWEETYKNEYNRILANADKDTSMEVFRRSDAKTLAKYIAKADTRDLSLQASAECDDAPLDSPEVVERTKELVAEREADIIDKVPEDQMLQLAYKRRAHFTAADTAGTAGLRLRVRRMVFGEDKEPLFDTDADITAVPADMFGQLMEAIATALNPPKDETPADPLS